MKHLDKREEFASDEQFANFRSLILCNKESRSFFRSASSTRNLYGRMEIVQKIVQDRGIKTIIDLATINHRCFDNEFGHELAKRFRDILAKDGPYIIQCDAGKKRTGFACIILEMLSGTDYDYIAQDYIKSYLNNNGLNLVSEFSEIERIRSQKVDRIIQFISETKKDVAKIDFVYSAKRYLSKYGFTTREIIKLHEKLGLN